MTFIETLVYYLPFLIKDICVLSVYTFGIKTGVDIKKRGQSQAGTHIILGFSLLGIEPLADAFIFLILQPLLVDFIDYRIFSWLYAIIGTICVTAGAYLIIRAFRSLANPKQEETSNPNQVIFAPDKK